MTDDQRVAHTARLRFLMARARRAGYQLIAEPRQPNRWTLVDLDDGERLFESASLGEIERYLSE
ncbi:hypothetical protein IU421_21220 [Nocardia cyriacigeorgica]|uniref:hypothetical protein n=1 Tax=Nocardia cyriacigeorgica TaxID=135487 RepID=UPI0018952B75|nr:hypothetical protein [Nocardia cyriacigeorgica]MBF6318114.1 hypothetical protein [Nocardia cyriacigeorgica]MBF6516782.1 hypothetical protein [Nocardia cyriacigeorgica]MBF6532894.1 hypothetical protein [Nocardia cyriacigeorgica]